MLERVFEGMLLKDNRNLGLRGAKISFYGKEQSLCRCQRDVAGLFRRPLVHRLLSFIESAFTHEIPDFIPALMPNTSICGVFIIFGFHLILQESRRFESITRRINFVCACEFTRGEVFKPEMDIKIIQLIVTDVRIDLVRQPHFTNSSLALVTFKLAIQKLKIRQVSFRKLRVEFLRATNLLFRALYPGRLR